MSPRVTEEYKRQRKLEIIRAARAVFWRKGYLQMVMQDVIDETGLSRGAVYDYFSNKDELFRAVIEDGDIEARTEFDALTQTSPVWPRLEELIVRTEQDTIYQPESATGIRAQIEYVVASAHDPGVEQWLRDRYEWFVSAYVAAFEAAVRRGELSPILPLETIARFVVSSTDGMHIGVMAAGAKAVRLADQTQALMQFLTFALGPKSS